MSLMVCGTVLGENSVSNVENMSFAITVAAAFERVGIRMGGNVSVEVYEKYIEKKYSHMLVFELLSSPLDNNAEELFNVYQITSEMVNTPINDKDSFIISFSMRMKQVQNLLKRMLSFDEVRGVCLNINYLFEDDNTIYEIGVDSFRDFMISKYATKNMANQPSLKLLIR